MSKKIFIPLGIREDVQSALSQRKSYTHFLREDRYQNIKIIKELKMRVEKEYFFKIIKTQSSNFQKIIHLI